MVTNYKSILGIVPTIHAASLAADMAKASKKRDKSGGDLIKAGTKALVGVPLIQVEAGLIGGL